MPDGSGPILGGALIRAHDDPGFLETLGVSDIPMRWCIVIVGHQSCSPA